MISPLTILNLVGLIFVTFGFRLRVEEDKYAIQQRQVIEQYRNCAQIIKDKILEGAQELMQGVRVIFHYGFCLQSREIL